MARFQELYKTDRILHSHNSPLIIEVIAIQKDTVDNKVLVQIKIRNIADKVIVGCKATINAYELNGTTLIETIKYSYLDINIKQGMIFGTKNPIYVPNETRRVDVSIDEIVFDNGELWRAEDGWKTIPSQEKLREKFKEEAIDELSKIVGKDCKYIPLEWEDLFFCSCGQINIKGEVCSNCGCTYITITDLLNNEQLIEKREERLKNEKEARQKADLIERKRQEEEREKKLLEEQKNNIRKRERSRRLLSRGLIILVILTICLVLSKTFLIPFIKKEVVYHDARNEMDNGNYEMAEKMFLSLDDFKDSKELADEASKEYEKKYGSLNYPDIIKLLESNNDLKALKMKIGEGNEERGLLSDDLIRISYDLEYDGIKIELCVEDVNEDTGTFGELKLDFVQFNEQNVLDIQLTLDDMLKLKSDIESLWGQGEDIGPNGKSYEYVYQWETDNGNVIIDYYDMPAGRKEIRKEF